MSVAPEWSSGSGGEIASPVIATVPPTTDKHLSFLMTEDQTDALAMTEDQNGALAAYIGHAFPVWRIWRANEHLVRDRTLSAAGLRLLADVARPQPERPVPTARQR